MEEMRDFSTHSPTPPLPFRNPYHHLHAHQLLPPLEYLDATDLVPPPLFCKKTRLPPDTIHVTVYEPSYQHVAISNSNSPTSPHGIWSPSRSISSTQSSPPSSPTSRARSLSSSSSPTPSTWTAISWTPVPQHTLRRKPSPKKDTLRSLRAKDSEVSLQRAYDQQTSAYLDGLIFNSAKPRSRLGVVFED